MAYIGQDPFQEFTNIPTKDDFTGDGSTVAFDMNASVPSGAENMLEVYVDNVRQEPGTGKAFTLGLDGSSDRKRITFSAAPANGASIYVINDKTNTSAVAPLATDLNGTELILDGDGDTSITADSDDRIDIKIGGVEALAFSEASGDAIIQIKTDAKDLMFRQFDGRDVLEINDAGFVGLHNGTTGSGQLRIYEDDDNGANFSAFQVGTQSADITYTLPTADGTTDFKLTTNASGVLSWTASHLPTSADGQALGSASLEWSDLFLADASTIQFGADQDVILTHVADTGLLLSGTNVIQFNDASQNIGAPSNAILDINATDEIELNATLIDVNGNLDLSGNLIMGSATVTEAQLEILDGATVTTTELNILDADTSASSVTIADADQIILNDNGTMKQVAVSALNTYTSSSVASSSISGGSSAVLLTTSSGNITIDAAASDSDIILKGTDGGADTTFLTIDGSAAGEATFNAGIVIADDGVIGSASDKDAIAIASDGVVTFSQNPVGTLATAAQGNVTSLGTLTALVVDDVAIDGKAVTMTGSSSDTAVFTAGTNGTLSIVTTDAAAAAANITITADGTAELAGTTVTLNSSGGVTLDADNGTITFADAGSSLGTITSSGYSGTAAIATAVTITDNESTNENNAVIFTAGGDTDGGNLGLESDGNLTYNPSTGTLSATNLVVTGTQTITNSVTMNASNAVVFEGSTADAHETTLTTIDATGDRTISLPNVSGTLPVLAAVSATAITSTPAELNILDGATVVVGEINALDIGSTAVGTAVASKAVILDSSKDYTGIRNLTISGEIDAATGDFSGAVDVAGATTTAAITASGIIKTDDTTAATSTTDGSLQTDGGLSVAGDAIIGDDVKLLSDGAVLSFGADSEFTLTHVHNEGLTVNTGMYLHFRDTDIYLGSDNDGDLMIVADDEIDLTSTLIDINGNVEISGTAVTTGVHTFTAVPVFPNNTIESADIQADAITGAKIADNAINSEHYTDASIDTAHIAADQIVASLIADNAINSEHYTDGSIDTAHIAALQVTGAKLALDRRSANATDDVKMGNQHDYIFADADVGLSFFTANAEDMRLTDAGVLHVDDDVVAFSSTISDERLKDNIVIVDDALNKVEQLKGVTFTYKENGKDTAGIIAQDLQKVLPCAVTARELPLHTKDDGEEYLTVNYDALNALLVESIKELSTALQKATTRIETLENR